MRPWQSFSLVCCIVFGFLPVIGEEQKLDVRSPDLEKSDFVKIPAGWFTMGHDQRAPDQKPAHRVYLDAFEIDRFEVSNQSYYQFWKSKFSKYCF